ncbi:hypothetical protein SAMN05216420_101315 [Nitrosospira sp. Nl5]|uniref:hypothetical protein n=1 Tax=Nitrosospira sp. Nl5 TaxID=200120 RepID=UPI000887982C|nr:hypothetical protein [Nitrosospira sp. Nl5]SCX91315.1 hypothetical protein SAMN05216420_101315 [Nitrosospira sp. Nl5]
MRTFILIEDQPATNDQDALFQHVFDNLRNVIICATLTLAGAGVIKFRTELEPFGATINAAVGILLILTAFFLCGWNMVNGYKRIVTSTQGTTKAGVYVLAFLVYGFLAFAVLQAWGMLQTKKLHTAVPAVAVERVKHAPAPFTLTLDCSLDPASACTKNVVLVPYTAYQEDMRNSSVVSFLIEDYIPWTDAVLSSLQ